jgi:hypothetical protein
MFVNKILYNYWRTTHYKDIVPHVPPKKILNIEYLHSCTEIFENKIGELILCSSTNCEDSNCSNQYSLSETNVKNHEYYLQHLLTCEESISKN